MSRHDAGRVLALVSESERACDLGSPSNGRRWFREIGGWLIAEDYLDELIVHARARDSGRLPPGLPLRPGVAGMAQLLWRRRASARVSGSTRAQALARAIEILKAHRERLEAMGVRIASDAPAPPPAPRRS